MPYFVIGRQTLIEGGGDRDRMAKTDPNREAGSFLHAGTSLNGWRTRAEPAIFGGKSLDVFLLFWVP